MAHQNMKTTEKDVLEDRKGPTRDIEIESGEVENVTPALAKRFNLFSTLGISYSITATPLSVGTYLSVVIGVGGSPVYFFGYMFSVILNLLVCLCLAEIASVYPHTSGQVWWTAALASKQFARPLSYTAGWFACAAWFFWFSGTCLITSQLLCALITVCNNVFVAQAWHYYLLYVAAAIFSYIVNVPLVRMYPTMLKGLVVWINACALFILISLLVRTHPKTSAIFVFTDFVNETGWSSNGLVFFLGLLPGAVAVNGFDSAAHMSDELPNPARQVPQVMLGSAFLSAISGLSMIIVYMFCNSKPENLLNPVGQQPIAQLMVDSFDSTTLTIIGLVCFISVFLAASVTILTTFSRVWWSLAREGAVPFSPTMAKISNKSELPINSILFCVFITLVLGTIELGSSTAINAILGTSVICIYISYMIPITCSILGRRNFTHKGYLNLGRAGMTLSIISVIWMALESVWLMFPSYLPVTGTDMNYSVAVLSGVVLFCSGNWMFYSRKTYVVPVVMH